MSTDHPTKSWWSLSKAGNKELRQNYIDVKSDGRPATAEKPSSGLKSIAVAIGLKSKKPSKEPLSPADRSQVSGTTSGPSSIVDSLTAYAPFNTRLQPARQSLLTLADDPFAGHPPVVFVRQSPVPSRLSVYSSPSVTDLVSRKPDSPVYRSSFASSSTNSNSLGPEVCSTSMSNALPESKKLRLKRSIGSMQVKLPDDLSRQIPLMSSTSSLSTEESHPGSDEASGRPRMRARGMTVGGPPPKSGFFVKEQLTQRRPSQASITSNIPPALLKPPEVLCKMPFVFRPTSSSSSSRLVSPPTAPPAVSLPAPPPTIPEQPNFRQRKGLSSHHPFSSSLVNNHLTSLGPTHDDIPQQALPGQDSENVEPSLASRTLKKPPSQRSLRRAASPPSSMSSKTTTPDASEKRKQRNSQQSRLPMSTLSLSIRTSLVSTSSQPRNGDPTSPSSIIEQRKPRKRLFSSSQRPSTSTCAPISAREDDSSSVFSQRSDRDTIRTPYKPWAVTRNYPKPSSFWDESADTTPRSSAVSTVNVDYQPKAIMSRDELAKLEESISHDKSERDTPLDSTLSVPLSISPEALEQEPSRLGLSPPPSMIPRRNSARSSCATLASLTLHSDSPRRPVTADPLIKDSTKGAAGSRRRVVSTATPRLDTIPDLTSLPPPPRRRLLSTNSVRSTASTSTTSTLIQSPVINSSKINLLDRPNAAVTTTNALQPGALGPGGLLTTTLPVPRSHATSRGRTRTSGVLEKAIHRRSIMRKPSFLEIDGETDPDSEPEVAEKRDSLFLNMKPPSSNGSSKTGESFLDFARESFDTVRS